MSCVRWLFSICCAAGLVANALTPLAASAQTMPVPPGTSDLSHYDCAALTDPTVRVMHIGQVIRNVYTEWQQFYRLQDGARRTICIALMRPAAKTLAATEASDFLAHSQAVDALSPQAPASAMEHAQSTYTLPANAKPLGPLKLRPMSPEDAKSPPSNHVGTPLTPLKPIPLPDKSAPVQAPAIEKQTTSDVGNRSPIANTTVFPFNVVGQLVLRFPNGDYYFCSGTLVSPYVVLTAGHCAFNPDEGGFATLAVFAPGQNVAADGTVTTPFGVGAANYLMTNAGWLEQAHLGNTESILDAQSDYAAFFFPAGFTYTTTFMPILYGDTSGGVVNAIGYPTYVNSNRNYGAWISAGPEDPGSIVIDRGYQVREFSLTVSPGQSGGPFVLANDSNYYIVGVLTYGENDDISFAGGPWMGGPNQALIASWALWTPDQATLLAGGPGVVSQTLGETKIGLRIPLVFSSSTNGFSSYLRLANSDARAGVVRVLVSDGATGTYLGAWTSPAIAVNGTFQVAIKDIEAATVPAIDPLAHSAYTLVVQSSFKGFFQNILWNERAQSLTNISACKSGLSRADHVALGVNTTTLAAYPSEIVVHNIGTAASTVKLYLWADSGKYLGTYLHPTPLAPDADLLLQEADLERGVGLAPGPDQSHIGVVLDGGFPGYMEHLVTYTASGLIMDMTAKCDLQ